MWSQSCDEIIVGMVMHAGTDWDTGREGGRLGESVDPAMLMCVAWCLQVRHKYTRQVMVMKEMRNCTEEAKKSFLKEASQVWSHSQERGLGTEWSDV